MSGGAKEYTSIVTIENMPEEELRPGMTAEVRVMVKTLSQVMVVPLGAVAERKGLHYAFVEGKEGAIERRQIKVGDSNEKVIQVLEGLSEGEPVVLDARIRADAEFKDEESEEDLEAKPATQAAPEPSPAPAEATP